jgi:hypothetical protein
MDPNEHQIPPQFDPWPFGEDLHPYATGIVELVDIHCLALLHFKDTIAPESSLLDDWLPSDGDQRWYCLGVIREMPPGSTPTTAVSPLCSPTGDVARNPRGRCQGCAARQITQKCYLISKKIASGRCNSTR